MTLLVFWIVVASATLAIAGVLLSWGRPALRFWPPPRGGSWQAYLSWVFIEVTMFGPLLCLPKTRSHRRVLRILVRPLHPLHEGSALRALEPDAACPELALDGGHLVREG